MTIFHQTEEELVALSVRAPKSLIAQLKESAKEAGISMNTAVVQCIEHALEQEQAETALLSHAGTPVRRAKAK